LITGIPREFLVGDDKKDYHIHEKLATANSPFLANMIRKKEKFVDDKAPLFHYFYAWIYDRDGSLNFSPNQFSRPYARLVCLYILAYKLRAPAFVNAVLSEIIQTYKTTKTVVDNQTIKLVYEEGLQDHEIHELFADQIAHFGQATDITAFDNLDFAKAVSERLLLIRDSQRRHPAPNHYYIIKFREPEPEDDDNDGDDDDCVFVSENSAPGAPRQPSIAGARVKREMSATVEA
jgi:hypothetical protein